MSDGVLVCLLFLHLRLRDARRIQGLDSDSSSRNTKYDERLSGRDDRHLTVALGRRSFIKRSLLVEFSRIPYGRDSSSIPLIISYLVARPIMAGCRQHIQCPL